MNQTIENHLAEVLKHLYINPLEKCNLRCEICYTRKTSPILSEQAILKFIERYEEKQRLQTITFCGGEVFALPYFPNLVNTLTAKGIFVTIITNGTIDRLADFHNPNSVNIIVSLDGMESYHDKNRGEGNYKKSTAFLQKALRLGFHAEIFSIVTHQNMPTIDAFEQNLEAYLGQKIPVTYHPRKPPTYLMHHPISNITGKVEGFDFLNSEEMVQIMKERNTFPPKDLGCYQIALVSNGTVYGCCEGVTPIGTIDDAVEDLFNALRDRLTLWESLKEKNGCLGCSQPDFVCGIRQYLSLVSH